MTFTQWPSHLTDFVQRMLHDLLHGNAAPHQSNLHQLAQHPEQRPGFVRESAVAMRYLHFLGPLDWVRIPARVLKQQPLFEPLPYAPFLAACLVKVDQHITYMSQLRQYLVEHPALTWLLGFPLVSSSAYRWGFDVEASLPTHRHFTRMLRTLPNALLQLLLDSTVSLLRATLPDNVDFGHAVSLDTKHILAWVQENNAKAFLNGDERYNKEQQPSGDPDCRLGCKKRRNQSASARKFPLLRRRIRSPPIPSRSGRSIGAMPPAVSPQKFTNGRSES